MRSLGTVLAFLPAALALSVPDLLTECLLNTRTDLPKNSQPIYLRDDTFEVVVPRLVGNKSVIAVPEQKSITLACTGQGNYLLTGGKALSKAVCYREEGFRIEDRSVNLREVTCKTPIKPEVLESNKKCGHEEEGILFDVGFKVGETWVPVLSACHDVPKASTLYVDHVVEKLVYSGSVKNNNRPGFKEGLPRLYSGISVSRLYKKSKQKEAMEKQLERDDYESSDKFLSKGHLAADADFILSNFQYATYFYLNTAPQWYTINKGNWLTIENRVRQIAAKKGMDAEVRTGTQGILRLRDYSEIPREVFLDPENGRLPIPAYFWKSVIIGNQGIVFITSNDPFKFPDAMPCNDVCAVNGWRFAKGVEQGRVFCCSLKDAKRSIVDLPDVKVKSILTWV